MLGNAGLFLLVLMVVLLLVPTTRSWVVWVGASAMVRQPLPAWVDVLMKDHPEDFGLFLKDFSDNGSDALDDLRVVTHVNFIDGYAPSADAAPLAAHARGLGVLFAKLHAEAPQACEAFRVRSSAWRPAREVAPGAFRAAFEPLDAMVVSTGPHRESVSLSTTSRAALEGAHASAEGAATACEGLARFYGELGRSDDLTVAEVMRWHLGSRLKGTFTLLPPRAPERVVD